MLHATASRSSLFRLCTVAAAALVLSLTGIAAGDHRRADDSVELEGTHPAHWRVVWTEDPQTQALIAWSTAEAGTQHRVHFDTEPRAGDLKSYRFQTNAQRNGRHEGASPTLHYHHAQLSGLEPDTTYWFVLESDGEVGRELHFRTAPATDVPVVVLSGGDSRSSRTQRQAMNRRMAAMAAADPAILALLHGGDYIFSGVKLDQWSAWLSDHELATTEEGRVLPIVPTRGNHEAAGPLYDEIFGWPGGGIGRNFFTTRLTPEVGLVTLNTETAAGGEQKRFLRESLERGEDLRWQLVQYHRPIWPAVKRPSRGKAHWQPLFDEFRVDLVLESDGHVLKRTVPILGDEQHEDGVVYIGEGGLGVRQRTPDTDRWYLKPPGMAQSAHHVWRLDITADALRMRAVLEDGAVADDHTITPRAVPSVPR